MIRNFTLFLIIGAPAFADPIQYLVEPVLAPVGFSNIAMSGINDSGQVSGDGFNGTAQQAFIGAPSGGAAIPLPAGLSGVQANAINNSGQVVGYGNNGTTNQSFIGTTSGSTVIPLLGGNGAVSWAINGAGQVAGTSGFFQAFIGTASGGTTIPLPIGWLSAFGYAINDLGQVAGNVTNDDNGLGTQAFIGTTSGSTALSLPDGWSEAQGFAINDSGQVTGFVYNGTRTQAFIGTISGSTVIPLPTGATRASGSSLNNSGVVVGYSDAGGWTWDATDGTQLLNIFVPAGWNITDAISISNSGLILAQGSFDGGASEYVELSAEAPELASAVLDVTGLLLFGVWRLRSCRRCGDRSLSN